MQLVLTPELLIEAYRQGLFPMAYHVDSPHVHWLCPDLRGQLSIPHLHIPKKLKKTVLANLRHGGPYQIRINTAFESVIDECARATPERPESWINAPIRKACVELHKRGQAHSVECWQNDRLVGGLYGIALGGAFFGESMFSRATDTSKIALVHLAARLWRGGFSVLDAQFVNDHLVQFGVYEVPKAQYQAQLKKAISQPSDFMLNGLDEEKIVNEYFAMRSENYN